MWLTARAAAGASGCRSIAPTWRALHACTKSEEALWDLMNSMLLLEHCMLFVSSTTKLQASRLG